ncbi:hypothetical protein CBQ26_11830 [Deinococcus indicus]|uniref:Uncharacterized protein n=1 Tax=Deinococcus indicus TaxID=223556 RepID=A0A246BJG3_9DEIO|nr:hypothetical protein [Deinococcus indicus]OWL95445.1 hypothetical protein CBQ26_11830 [Deinococcus indicus]
MKELISPTGRRTIINALLTLPHDWDGQRTVHVRTADDVEAMMTVAPEIQADLRAAAARHAQHADRVTLHTDETGLHIVAVNVTPAHLIEAHQRLADAYRAAPAACDAAARATGAQDWADLVHGRHFARVCLGGTCAALAADVQGGYTLLLSNAGPGFPDSLTSYDVTLTHLAGEVSIFGLRVKSGQITNLYPAA